MKLLRTSIFVLLVVFLSLLSACSSGSGPETAVESYLQALVDGDQVGAVNASCADWEAQARAEAASFNGVEARLEGVSCSVSGESEDVSLVACEGVIVATYGAEDTQLPLEGRTYQLVEEGGEWRMCGYQ